MKPSLALFVLLVSLEADANVCTTAEYKPMCDKAVIEGIKRIQPYVTRSMLFVHRPELTVDWRNGTPYFRNDRSPFRLVRRTGITQLDGEGVALETCELGDCISESAGNVVVPATINAEANLVVNSSDVSALKSLEAGDVELPALAPGVNPCATPEYSLICQKSIIAGMTVLRQFNLVDGNKGIGAEIGKAVVSTIVAETIHIVVDHVRTVRAEAAKERAKRESVATPPSRREGPPARHISRPMDDPEPAPHPSPDWSSP